MKPLALFEKGKVMKMKSSMEWLWIAKQGGVKYFVTTISHRRSQPGPTQC
jgi:hypothetical protein